MSAAKKDMRTPLGRVLAQGSAKSGTGDHIRQRITAVAMVPLALFFTGFLVALTGADYETARSWLGNPFVSIAALLLVIAAIMHMRIGMQIIIEDYVTGALLRSIALIANFFFAYAVGLACVYAVVKIGFGA
ncbi:succinate dehydrogenase, hydrophobic membrane anchor protein [Parvibaculum sp.]|uniref:succinate dehydrogenase, hydrophobic membrane anchor protein n=1 Tax=Parvibaculum sp. TaxID=2024848 RepID=UPI003BAB54B2